jgi:hypothetical protein
LRAQALFTGARSSVVEALAQATLEAIHRDGETPRVELFRRLFGLEGFEQQAVLGPRLHLDSNRCDPLREQHQFDTASNTAHRTAVLCGETLEGCESAQEETPHVPFHTVRDPPSGYRESRIAGWYFHQIAAVC